MSEDECERDKDRGKHLHLYMHLTVLIEDQTFALILNLVPSETFSLGEGWVLYLLQYLDERVFLVITTPFFEYFVERNVKKSFYSTSTFLFVFTPPRV